MDIQIFLLGCLTTLYFILPAYFSNGGALAFGGGTPLDFGKKDSNGIRWIGDGVTWRGLIAGTLIGIITGLIQGLVAPSILSAIGPYIITPIITDVHSGIIIGFLLGFGALVGDALGSFLIKSSASLATAERSTASLPFSLFTSPNSIFSFAVTAYLPKSWNIIPNIS